MNARILKIGIISFGLFFGVPFSLAAKQATGIVKMTVTASLGFTNEEKTLNKKVQGPSFSQIKLIQSSNKSQDIFLNEKGKPIENAASISPNQQNKEDSSYTLIFP